MNNALNGKSAITCIRRDLTLEEVNNFGLVLSASNIAFRSVAYQDRWSLWVREEDQFEADLALYQYQLENEDQPRRPTSVEAGWGRTGQSWAGVWAALLLGVCHISVSSSGKAEGIVRAFNASAEAILNGEYYRTATALLLHADWGHLMSNMVGIALFGTVVCLRLGYGLGLLAILVTAMAGNMLNAMVYQSGHHSIGASTAVFSALGIVSMLQAVIRWRDPAKRKWCWLPPAAALALLAFLGASLKTDILAHFWGLLCGMVAGLMLEWIIQQPLKVDRQNLCLVLVALVLAGSWITGLQ